MSTGMSMADDLAGAKSSSAPKRPAESTETAVKRRAPYASKACDACRRRKGRCDGQEPCEYCVGRGWECNYTAGPNDQRRGASISLSDLEGSLQTVSGLVGGQTEGISDLTGILGNLQGQLNALAALVQATSTQDGRRAPTSLNGVLESANNASNSAAAPIAIPSKASPRKTRRFLGPTSPAYSFHAAKAALKASPASTGGSNNPIPHVSDDESSYSSDEDEQDGSKQSLHDQYQSLLNFRDMYAPNETRRLLDVYQRVIGDFHPIATLDSMYQCAERCYASPRHAFRPTASDSTTLPKLNIALAIALCTEPHPSPKFGSAIMDSCQEYVSKMLTYLPPCIDSMVFALMTAFYHFFRDDIVVCWRLCGIAGRTAMELGLHTSDAVRCVTNLGGQAEDVANIVASVIVLDRQWAAATGLPTHFSDSPFDKKLVQKATNPYLKAMLVFCTMSDSFAEPISRAATGEICEDDETFEIHNFQIEQWRKKALVGANLSHPRSWASGTHNREPWQFVVYLRANTVRKLLLRPFFLPSAGPDVGIRNLQSAIDLVNDTVDCIDWLDVSTDIYGRLHPHFQHCLTSACALLSLIVAFAGQRRPQIDDGTLLSISHFVNQNFRTALRLASKYASVSRQSNRLRKHLVSMEESLRRQHFLSSDLPATSIRAATGQANDAAVFGRGDLNDHSAQSTSVAAVRQFFPPPFQGLDSGVPLLAEAPTPGFRNLWLQDGNNAMSFGSPDLIDFSWPLNDPGGFF